MTNRNIFIPVHCPITNTTENVWLIPRKLKDTSVYICNGCNNANGSDACNSCCTLVQNEYGGVISDPMEQQIKEMFEVADQLKQ